MGSLLLSVASVAWQTQSRQLSTTVRQNELAARSIAVLPFLNLDTAQPDEILTSSITRSLERDLSKFGPSRVVQIPISGSWPAGTGNLQDIKEANSSAKARAVLTGGGRIVDGKLRLSIRLINGANGDVLLTRVVDLARNPSAAAEMVQAVMPALRSILSARDWSTISPWLVTQECEIPKRGSSSSRGDS